MAKLEAVRERDDGETLDADVVDEKVLSSPPSWLGLEL